MPLHQIEFAHKKDEVTLSFRGDDFTYTLKDGMLSAAEAERMSHDLLLLADRLYREDNARDLGRTGPEPLEPITAEVRGEADEPAKQSPKSGNSGTPKTASDASKAQTEKASGKS